MVKIKNILLSSLAVSYLFASSMQAVSLDKLYVNRGRLLPSLKLLSMTSKSLNLARKDIDNMSGLEKFRKLFNSSKLTIEKLSLSQNKIVEIVDTLADWEALEVLELDNNKIKEVPAAVGFLSNLKKLNLSCNDLHSISSRIQHMIKLEVLDLSNNKNLHDLPPEIVELKALKTLAIGNTQLTLDSNVIKAMLAVNPGLEVVDYITDKTKPASQESSFQPMGQVF